MPGGLAARLAGSRVAVWPLGWPIGWLADWLAAWLADWLADWMAGRLVGRLCDWLAGWPVRGQASRPTAGWLAVRLSVVERCGVGEGRGRGGGEEVEEVDGEGMVRGL